MAHIWQGLKSGDWLTAARARAYELAGTVSLRGGWYRRDIAARL